MKYIGIDYGTKKTGVALSDDAGTMGFPKGTYLTTPSLVEELITLIREQGVGEAVIGESRDFSGEENSIAEDAKAFAATLGERAGIPVHFEPETLTTQAARRFPDGTRMPGSPDVDASAAALILTSFLERKPTETARPTISIDDFSKIEVKVGTVLSAERIPDTDKLLRLMVDLGEAEPRQIVSGIAAYVSEPQTLVGRQLSFVTNLAPRKLRGLESNGMLFAAGEGSTFAFMVPDRPVPPGTSTH